MDNKFLENSFSELSTALISDACVRLQVPLRIAPSGIHPVVKDSRLAGRVLPARHRGSVDVFIEVMKKKASPGDVLVVDNECRKDESCVGDLTVLEARAWGVAGLIVRGYHRDTKELQQLGIPVFSYGSYPAGPRRLDQRGLSDLTSAEWDGFTVDSDDVVFADDDGVVFVPWAKVQEILKVAGSIWQVERKQAEEIKAGRRLFDQLGFDAYLEKRNSDPSYSLRRHLQERGGAVEV
jgi:4-hydroxy-4-methyl-2-oxoglutarate aldolase